MGLVSRKFMILTFLGSDKQHGKIKAEIIREEWQKPRMD